MTTMTARSLTTRIAFVLLWLFVFTLPITQAPEIPAIGMISRMTGLAAMAAGAIAVAARRKIRLLGPVHLAMAGFILWSAVTLCWSVAPDLTVQRVLTCLQLFVLVLLTWELCLEEKDVLRILSAFVLGAMIPALSTLQAFLPGAQTLYDRAATPGYNPNELAVMLALSLPAAYYLILREKTGISALYRLQMGLAVCAILFCGSAVSFIAMAVGLSIMCWTFHVLPVRTRASAFTVIVAFGGIAALFLPSAVWKHILDETARGGITFTDIMNTGVDTLHATPIGGLGAGSTSAAVLHSPALYKASFTMFAETGVIGLACFVAMLGVLFFSTERMTGVTRSFWFTILGVWAIGGCALNWESTTAAWLLFGLLAAHSACLKTEGVTRTEREQRRNYYVERIAEV